jgi:hypothetical protein
MKYEKSLHLELSAIIADVSGEWATSDIETKFEDCIRLRIEFEDFVKDAAKHLVRKFLKASDTGGQGELFPADGIVRLGDGKVIPRKDIMSKDTVRRRREVINANRDAVVTRCDAENDWLDARLAFIAGL